MSDERAWKGLKPLYDFGDIEPDRPFVLFRGNPHYFKLPGDFGPLGMARLQKLEARFEALRGQREDLSDAELATMQHVQTELCKMLVDPPADDYIEIMGEQKRTVLIELFTSAVGEQLPEAETPPEPDPETRSEPEDLPQAVAVPRGKSTTARKSRPSRGSTGGARKTG